ncbi:MAG: glycosyltransferase family 4 protein [Gemmatales bacterium]|nr:glycosyltransferase family 4 protein [Gemmatales bacterium]MDW8386977.1 glycosyltransferase family 4 protein [Gemmatales bacterium]
MRAAVLAHNACEGDAIGNRLAAKVRFLLQRGWQIRVFLETTERLHSDLAPFIVQITAGALRESEEYFRWLCESDLVLVEFGVSFGLLHLLPLLPKPGPRILAEYHGVTPPLLWPIHQRWRWEMSLRDRDLLRWADRITVLSDFAARELQEALHLSRERIRVVPGFVEPEIGTTCPSELRRRWRLEGSSVLLFVGRLAPNKRPTVVVETVHRLRHRIPTVHAVFLGPKDDIYAEEAEKCRVLAESLGIRDRIHLVGWVSQKELDAWYQAADVLVVPSVHEGFCLPVVEAMARGLPVVAARAAALPETVGSAGLTFEPDDVADLVRQLERVLASQQPASGQDRGKLAIVMPRFGPGFVGGAERSLTRIAQTLSAHGWQVEIFTTDAADEAGHRSAQKPGSRRESGFLVHRYPIEPGNPEKLRSVLRETEPSGKPESDLSAVLRFLPRSAKLVDDLELRLAEFDAVFVGPYSHGLTWQIAARMLNRTILVPCFHNEPLARHPAWLRLCRNVSALLYHSPEERRFAETALGINHPISDVIGTWLEPPRGDARRGRERIGHRYVLYCGRCIAEKGFPQLLEWMKRFHRENDATPKLVVLGCRDGKLPAEPWLVDLGFVGETEKADLLAGAEALLLLSGNESLSLVVLEAWNEGTPVIVSSESEVLVGQVGRSNGGIAVAHYDQFAAALLSLQSEAEKWRQRGAAGRHYVEQNYRCAETFARRIETVLENRRQPLREVLAEAGRRRAAEFSLERWEQRFAAVVEEVLACPAQVQPAGPTKNEKLLCRLAELHRLQTLPDDYLDITHGPLAEWKKRIKRKLLHNFRTAYVDVLSRQQSRFNTVLVEILTELIAKQVRPSESDSNLSEEVKHLAEAMRRLRRRLARLEKQVQMLARSWS